MTRQKICGVIQHLAFEGLGSFSVPLERAGYHVTTINAADGIPDVMGGEALLIILGGPVSANDCDSYPFLREELRLIERRLNRELPLIGICLGAQLIAKATGARVYSQHYREIGFAPIELTKAGETSCLAPYADAPTAFHWHGETFDLPTGASHLARSLHCETQAFSIGAHTIGFQFHPEALTKDVEHWLVGHAAELGKAGLSPEFIREDAKLFQNEMRAKGEKLISAWLTSLEGVVDAETCS